MGPFRRGVLTFFCAYFSFVPFVAKGEDASGFGVDEALHLVNILRGHDLMVPAYKPFSGSGVWLRPIYWRGDSQLSGGAYADGSGKGVSVGCCLSTAKLAFIPLAASIDVFASQRDGTFEYRENSSAAAEGRCSGLGGSVAVHVFGFDLRAMGFYERVKSADRGHGGAEIKSDALHLGAHVSHKMVPLGPIGAGPELTLIATRLSASEENFDGVIDQVKRSLRETWSSATNWHVAPGLFVSFSGSGRSSCRICGRWNWDLGHKPTVREFIPQEVGAWNVDGFRRNVKWPKSGYGDLEMAFCIGLGTSMFAEASVIAHSVNRRGVCAALTVGKGF